MHEEVTFNIFPNPFVDKITIEIPLEDVVQVDRMNIRILDARGQLIDEISDFTSLVNGLNKIEWEPLFDLVGGVYLVQIQINDKMYSQRILHLGS